MLQFLLILIALYVVWRIVRYEFERRAAAREEQRIRKSLSRGAGLTHGIRPSREQVEQSHRDFRATSAAQAAHVEQRIQEILKTTPWRQRGAMRTHLRNKVKLGYDI